MLIEVKEGVFISIPLWFGWENGTTVLFSISVFISIPLWFGWEVPCRGVGRHVVQFQFHYGSVGRKQAKNATALQVFISIPLWFGWECWN